MKDGSIVHSRDMLELWPTELLNFLESKIVFQMPETSDGSDAPPELAQNVVGLPDEIIGMQTDSCMCISTKFQRIFHSLGCTDMSDELKYLCKWTTYTTAKKVVASVDAKEHFPHLVAAFLEGNLDGSPFSIANKLKNVTRSMAKLAIRENISVDTKVEIVRDISLEKTLLRNTGRIIQRRNTTTASSVKGPTALKTVNNIPFGARGRKRKTTNVVYIGLQPNPDGRNLVGTPSVNSDAVAAQYLKITPGRRTYARAMSTPLPSTTTAEDASTTSEPVIDLEVSVIDEQNTTFDLHSIIDGSDVGNLHYSSSESSEY